MVSKLFIRFAGSVKACHEDFHAETAKFIPQRLFKEIKGNHADEAGDVVGAAFED